MTTALIMIMTIIKIGGYMKICENCNKELILEGGGYDVDGNYLILTENCRECGQEYETQAYIGSLNWSAPEIVWG